MTPSKSVLFFHAAIISLSFVFVFSFSSPLLILPFSTLSASPKSGVSSASLFSGFGGSSASSSIVYILFLPKKSLTINLSPSSSSSLSALALPKGGLVPFLYTPLIGSERSIWFCASQSFSSFTVVSVLSFLLPLESTPSLSVYSDSIVSPPPESTVMV